MLDGLAFQWLTSCYLVLSCFLRLETLLFFYPLIEKEKRVLPSVNADKMLLYNLSGRVASYKGGGVM